MTTPPIPPSGGPASAAAPRSYPGSGGDLPDGVEAPAIATASMTDMPGPVPESRATESGCGPSERSRSAPDSGRRQRRNRELHHRGGPGIASGSGWGRSGLLLRPVPPGADIVRAGGVRDVSLIGMSSFDGVACPRDPAALLVGALDGDPVVGSPDAPDTVVYLLVYSAPEGPAGGDAGGGWTLLARHDTGWGWSRSLAAHGAGVHAPARVAKAVAVRVLSGQGVAVESWPTTSPPTQRVPRWLLSAPTAARSARAPRCVVFRKLQKGLPPRGSQ